MPVKICLVSNFKDKGYGESTRPYYLSLELQKLGYDILHICDAKTEFKNGIQYIQRKPFSFPIKVLDRLINFLYLFAKVHLFGPRFIYVHQFNNGQWALSTRTLPKVTFIFDAHTSLYFESEAFGIEKEILTHVFNVEKEICEHSNYIIAASEETRDILIKLYHADAAKFFVVKNATAIHSVPQPEKVSGEEFICSATLPFHFKSNEMALEFLFEVAAKVYQLNSKIQFHVLGGGDKPVPPTPNIVYTGYVEDIEAYLLKSNICLSPYPEKAVCGGARNKVCDYLALGKAIVSTKEGMRGFSDLVDGVHYLNADTVEDFAKAIIKLQTDNPLRKKVEKNALEISHQYKWNKRAQELNSIFQNLK